MFQRQPAHLPEIEVLDLHDAGIDTAIWALGYGYDFGWIDCEVLDARGAPVQSVALHQCRVFIFSACLACTS